MRFKRSEPESEDVCVNPSNFSLCAVQLALFIYLDNIITVDFSDAKY